MAKRRKNDEEDDASAIEENMNILPPNSQYSAITRKTMSQLSEREVNFEIITQTLTYIKNTNIPGSVLVFLPGWSNIFAVMRYLQEHPIFGEEIHYLKQHQIKHQCCCPLLF